MKRVLIKLSGELLARGGEDILNPSALKALAQEILALKAEIPEIVLVIGAGNILRGRLMEEQGMDRVRGDYMGMLATIMNAIAMQDALEQAGAKADVLTSFFVPEIGELYSKHRANQLLEAGHIVICAGGTGNPYFSTDTAGALRSIELGCELYVKGTKVDGIFDKDPEKHSDAVRLPHVTFEEILIKGLRIMDQAAFALCKEHGMRLKVANMSEISQIKTAVLDDRVGSLITT
ncbi:UMP kinase [Candidatus Gracilibacteria bacterium CG17_big_fil_post_rev_8_21_14_2_50_48_13]|nr:MAG: UMP kinase [Candidatus Gracilibacteria bacterium CG17_big_fil_post_rev_8_21_14_2_50_48_13]